MQELCQCEHDIIRELAAEFRIFGRSRVLEHLQRISNDDAGAAKQTRKALVPRPGLIGASQSDGEDRRTGEKCKKRYTGLTRQQFAVRRASPLGKNSQSIAALQQPDTGGYGLFGVSGLAADRDLATHHFQ